MASPQFGRTYGCWSGWAAGLALFILTALILSNNFYLLFLLGAMDVLIVLTGAWATLQFKWLQKDSPGVSLVMEKLLLGCLPVRTQPRAHPLAHSHTHHWRGALHSQLAHALSHSRLRSASALIDRRWHRQIPASVVLTWAAISAYGFDLAPFFLLAFAAAGVALCGVPLPSSFLLPDAKPLDGGDGPAVVVERTETKILIGYLLLAPCTLHIALHYSVLFDSGLGNITTMLALLALPVLLLRIFAQQGILWCFGGSPQQLKLVANITAGVAGVVLLYVIEVQIIFVNFAHYILLPEPMATAAVTLGLYGGVGTLFCVLTGALRNSVILSAIASTAGVAVSLALGMPIVMLWAPLIAALGFVRFYSECYE